MKLSQTLFGDRSLTTHIFTHLGLYDRRRVTKTYMLLSVVVLAVSVTLSYLLAGPEVWKGDPPWKQLGVSQLSVCMFFGLLVMYATMAVSYAFFELAEDKPLMYEDFQALPKALQDRVYDWLMQHHAPPVTWRAIFDWSEEAAAIRSHNSNPEELSASIDWRCRTWGSLK